MFENNGHVHGFITPGEGQTIPLGFSVEYTLRVVVFLCRSYNFDIHYYFLVTSEHFRTGIEGINKASELLFV